MSAAVEHRLLTIGTVCRRLKDDFPEISISNNLLRNLSVYLRLEDG